MATFSVKSKRSAAKNLIQKTGILFVVALLLVQAFPSQGFAEASEDAPLIQETSPDAQLFANETADLGDVLDSLTVGLYADQTGTQPITSGMTVSKNDSFWFLMNFTESGDSNKVDAIQAGAHAGTKFIITDWPSILVPSAGMGGIPTGGLPLIVQEDDGPHTFGVLSYGPVTGYADPMPYVEFEAAYWDTFDEFAEMNGGYIGFECQLDGAEVGQQEEVTIDVPYSVSVAIKIAENQPVKPTISKNVSLDPDSMKLTWTVQYTVGSDPAEAPYFIDSFANDVQFYESGSFAIDGAPESGVIVADNAGTTTLEFDLTTALIGKNVGDTIGITYNTVIADEELAPEAADTEVSNSAQIQASQSAATPVSQDSASTVVSEDDKKWITKFGQEDGASRKIDWTVVVKTMDRNLANVAMYDELPSGLTLDVSTIRVNGTPLPNSLATYADVAADPDGKPASFEIAFTAPIQDTYTITYSTKVDDSYFDQVSTDETETFDNNAWLSYTWYQYGSGTTPVDFQFVHPTIETSVDVHTSVVKKSVAVAYDAATHIITWQVDVNPHGVDITSGQITDLMPQSGSNYILEFQGDISSNVPGLITKNAASDATQLIVDVGAIGTATYSYTYETKVIDTSYTSYNTKDLPITNKATFDGVATTGIITDDESTASTTISSEVLHKSGAFKNNEVVGGTSYDNVVTWTVVVNKNAMADGFAHAVIEDDLGDYQTFIPDSVAISQGTLASSDIDYTNNKLTVDLGSKAQGNTITLTYKTSVDADKISDFKDKALAEISNSATLDRPGSGLDTVTAVATVKVPNKPIDKSLALKTDDGTYLEYTVNLNPFKLDLGGVQISDVIPAGLAVNLDSIQLKRADVSASGAFSATATTYPLDSLGFVYTPPDGTNGGAFSLTLPAGKNAYQLVYQCDVTEIKASYVNNFGFLNGGFGDGVDQGSNTFNGSGLGGATSTRTAQLAITKENSVKGTSLEGVEFGLYREVAGQAVLVDTIQTDAFGKAAFVGLAKNTDYTIKEITPLAGFSNPIVVFSNSSTVELDDFVFNSAVSGRTEIVITNDPTLADVEFTKVNDWGQTLAGVEFSLFDPADLVNPVSVQTSDGTGLVRFADVHFGTYILRETAASVPNHDVNTAEYTVSIDPDGSYTIKDSSTGLALENDQFVNEAWTVPVEIEIFEESTGEPIEGSLFNVVDDQGNVLFSGTSDKKGLLSFRLPAGQTFTVVEVSSVGEWEAVPDQTFSTPTLQYKGEITSPLSIPWPKRPVALTPDPDPPVLPPEAGTGGTPGGSPQPLNTHPAQSDLARTGDSFGLGLACFASGTCIIAVVALIRIRRAKA